MKEDLIQFVWSHQLYNQSNLKTADGDPITILKPGTLNMVSGPDFSDARVTIDGTNWIGHVEIHVRASDWYLHGHEKDVAYNNVILHVVYENDTLIKNQKGDTIPTLSLNGRLSKSIVNNYSALQLSKSRLPCSSFINDVSGFEFTQWLDRLLIERLQRKIKAIELIYRSSGCDWMQTFYMLFVSYFGQNQNKLAFQQLARILPYNIISKYLNRPLQVESLLFGVAGLVPTDTREEYPNSLKMEYQFLKSKHELSEINQIWKFGGIRPDAFPTRRMAQLGRLLPELQHIYQSIIDCSMIDWALDLDISHPFWDRHYSFNDDKQRQKTLSISTSFKDIITINVFAPFAFHYGLEVGSERHKSYAVELLQSANPESNAIIKQWQKHNRCAGDAAQSQALIELTNQYCQHKNCVLCNVGKTIISKV